MELRNEFLKLLFSAILTASMAITAKAQVALRPIVEHFTNTKCSICASKNPALYTNLNANPSVTHLSVHPSSPYASCILSQQNTVNNDARTNFYNIYGGTPRIVINGNVVNGSNFGSPTLFTPHLNQTTPFDLEIQQTKHGNGFISTRVVVKAVATHGLTAASLFVGLVEDTVFVNGGNGEDEHYNVMRDAVTSPQGITIAIPTNPGDSTVFDFTSPSNNFWDISRIYAIAILQDATSKQVLQTGKTDTSSGVILSSTDDIKNALQLTLYPNPAQNILYVELQELDEFVVELYTPSGALAHRGNYHKTAAINTALLENGMYFLSASSGNKSIVEKIIIQH